MADSHSLYDFVVAVLRGEPTSAAQRARAFAVPAARWERVLGFDGCAVQFDRALQHSGLIDEAPVALSRLLRDASSMALQRALLVHRQLPSVAAVAAAAGIRVMALKGAARLLAGEMPATRSIADIDLLAAPADAARLHAALQRELGYTIEGASYPHHLAGLTRAGSLGIELHVRLTPLPLPLDAEMWRAARRVECAGYSIELPSATNLLLHTLEHAVRVNWTARFRLRDILDLAALTTADVDTGRVARYVAASDCRRAMETALGAAQTLAAARHAGERRAWSTVRRIGRMRSRLATVPRTALMAERCFRYAGALAEGSPRTLGRLGLDLARRLAGGAATMWIAAAAASATISSCRDSVAPKPFTVGPFVFAATAAGRSSLYRYRDGVVTALSSAGTDDREPHSVANQLVFTSLRDGNAEIYGAALNGDLTLGTQSRLTNEYATDTDPALSPSGATIAFVSGRGGAPRIWLMEKSGANPRPLDTGSPDYVPENGPRWSPTGDRLVFTSTRTGGSQVFVVPATGGVAMQLSHETRGAYTPAWLPNGAAVLFMALGGPPRVLSVAAAGGDATIFASDSAGVGEPACTRTACLAVLDPLGSTGQIVALTAGGTRSTIVIPQVGDDRHPAFLLP